MTLNLLKRAEKGSPLTALEHDTNFTNIEDEVNAKANITSLATVATSGNYADLSGKPQEGVLLIPIKNTSAATITKGTPVYATGTVGDTNVIEVAAADAGNAAKAPAICLANQDLIVNAIGTGIMFGDLTGINTNSFNVNDELYLASGGGLTATKPTSGVVQALAVVTRKSATTGSILVWVAGELPQTDLTYDASTRVLSSSTGADVTLPVVSTANAGLQLPTSFTTITYAATTNLDLAVLDGQYRTINLTGNLTLTTSNLANGRSTVIRLVADATQRTLTFPTNWKFIGIARPANLAASKTGVLSVTFFGGTDADAVAAWSVEP